MVILSILKSINSICKINKNLCPYKLMVNIPNHRFISTTFISGKKEDSSGIETISTKINLNGPVLSCLKKYGFNEDSAVNLLSGCPQIETLNPEKLDHTLNAWFSCQFGEDNLVKLLTNHPQLLLAHHSRIEEIFLYLSSHFLKKYVFSILISSPLVMTENPERLNEKLNYFEKDMAIGKGEIAKSGALSHPLDYIRERHEFLKRAGVFKMTRAKDSVQIKQKNPRLDYILNTSDNEFSTRVAGLTLQEFEAFQQIMKLDY